MRQLRLDWPNKRPSACCLTLFGSFVCNTFLGCVVSKMGLCASNTTSKTDNENEIPKANPVVPSPDNSPDSRFKQSKNKAGERVKKRGSGGRNLNTSAGGISPRKPGDNTVTKSRSVPKGDEKWRKGRLSFREQMKRDRAKFLQNNNKQKDLANDNVVVQLPATSPKNAIASKQGEFTVTDYD